MQWKIQQFLPWEAHKGRLIWRGGRKGQWLHLCKGSVLTQQVACPGLLHKAWWVTWQCYIQTHQKEQYKRLVEGQRKRPCAKVSRSIKYIPFTPCCCCLLPAFTSFRKLLQRGRAQEAFSLFLPHAQAIVPCHMHKQQRYMSSLALCVGLGVETEWRRLVIATPCGKACPKHPARGINMKLHPMRSAAGLQGIAGDYMLWVKSSDFR